MGIATENDDQYFMRLALAQAELAAQIDEVPVGAVVVYNNEVIAQAHNAQITTSNPTAHAEILVLERAAEHLSNYRLSGCDLYVTLEPCLMCVGAMVHARINRLVFGATDSKTGMAITVETMFEKPFHNHKVIVQSGVLAEECGHLLSRFFQQKRQTKKCLKS